MHGGFQLEKKIHGFPTAYWKSNTSFFKKIPIKEILEM